MRRLAPTGTPITFQDLSFWMTSVFSKKTTVEMLNKAICQLFEVKNCYFFSTGRAAMALLLQCFAELATTEKDIVIIPSYTCFSIPSSIIKAGLKIKVCDINPKTLDYDYQKLESMDFRRVLAVISGNLYGIPNDLDRLEKLTLGKNIYLIDDAAQCMGARSASGRMVGTHGDAGLFSFDKGKVITSMNGGVLVTNSSQLSSIIRPKIDQLSQPSMTWCITEMIKMIIYSLFLHPSLYWIPDSLPFLKLGTTIYTTDYPVERYNDWLSGLVYHLFKHLSEINEIRIDNGSYYRENLPHSPKLKHIVMQSGVEPIYLRYPIRITDKSLRQKTIEDLQKSGLGATCSYPSSIVDIIQLQEAFSADKNTATGGKKIASQIVTLPTHPYVTRSDQNKINTLIAKTLR